MKTISCIIPAYNEEGSIGRILSIVTPLINKELLEVVVIDDCSSDNTKQIIETFPSVQFIKHDVNQGKSKTVADGIRIVKGEYSFLLDADLEDLDEKNIRDLIHPITEGRADMTISYRRNAWPLFPFKKIDFLSGERILPTAAIIPSLAAMSKLPSYGLEVFLNRITIAQQMRICVVPWPNVGNVFHHEKFGLLRGIPMMFKIWWQVVSTAPIPELYMQNIRMQKLLVREENTA